MSADTNWRVQETTFPRNGSPREKLGFALKYALLASSEEAWRPCQFRVNEAHIELFTHDPTRPEASDPDDREAFINCGACLFHLKLALKHFGCLGRVELFPDLDQPALAVRVFAGFGQERDAQEGALFAAMARDRASFSPLDERPASTATLDLFRYAALGERAWLEFAQSEFSRQRLFSLAAAVRQQPLSSGRRKHNEFPIPAGSRGGATASTVAVNRTPGAQASGRTGPFLSLSVRTSDSGQFIVETEGESSGQLAAMAVVKSRTDDKYGWVEAGQATARVLLYAEISGLSWSFLNQALRSRIAREELLTGMGRKGFPQIIIRFGSRMPLTTVQPAATRSLTATSRG